MSREKGFIWVNDTEAGAVVPPEGHIVYARDTDTHLSSDGTTLTAMGGGGGGLDAEGAQDAVGAMVDTSLVYTDATPLLSRAALTGDVTAAEGSNTTTIANDAVTYAKIQNVTDDRLLGRSAGSSGDVQEITVGSSLDLSSATLALPAWMNKYNPMRPPASLGTGGVSDEFIGGTTLSYSWQNQESSTATATRDGLELYHPADATGEAAYWFTGPDGSSTDWVFHARLSVDYVTSFNQSGILLLATGTEAAPTLLYDVNVFSSGANRTVGFRSRTSYTSAATSIGNDQQARLDHYFRLSYVSSTKVLTASFSDTGYIYNRLGSTTLAAHPTTSFGLHVGAINATYPSTIFCHFVRVRTDASMLNPGS